MFIILSKEAPLIPCKVCKCITKTRCFFLLLSDGLPTTVSGTAEDKKVKRKGGRSKEKEKEEESR